MRWVLGALCISAPVLVLVAFWLTDYEIDDVLDDSLRQTALLLADRDLAGTFPTQPSAPLEPYASTESMLVAVVRDPGGVMMFTSQPEVSLRFDPRPGASIQIGAGTRWHVFTVVQPDRVIQVAQPVEARRELAAESSAQLLAPLVLVIALIGALLVYALRRGLRPLREVGIALEQRSALSLAPLPLERVPVEILPLVRTLNELLQRLETAFAAQRNFVADAAHELRSPITALQLQVQLLERSEDPAAQSAATAELSAGIARARHLIEQLLVLSRAAIEEGDHSARFFESVSLAELAREAVVRWSSRAELRGIDLGARIEQPASVFGVPLQLAVMINNLIDNALRYSRPGGTVDVVVGLVAGTPTLRVIDSGVGLPEAEFHRVFDRFYRAPRANAQSEIGSGLGLAIVKAIADSHRARVTLHPGYDGVGLEARIEFEMHDGERKQ